MNKLDKLKNKIRLAEGERDAWKDAAAISAEELDKANTASRIIVADHKRMEAERDKLRDAFVQAKALLNIAKCPQCDGSGEMVVSDMHPTMPVPCLWCIERKQALEDAHE